MLNEGHRKHVKDMIFREVYIACLRYHYENLK